MSLSELMVGRKNNLDLIRFIAAVMVLISHSFPLTQGNNDNELLFFLTKGQATLGNVAVFIFFITSGYLIAQSYERTGNLFRFIEARFLRIIPGLIFAVMVTAFIIGPIVTSKGISTYFSDTLTFKYLLTPSILSMDHPLPGVFDTNTYKGVVNGSLWTLRFEILCYVVVAALGVVGMMKKRIVVPAFIAMLFISLINFSSNYLVDNFCKFFLFFSAGMVVYVAREQIRLNNLFLALSVVALCCSAYFGWFAEVFSIAGTYALIYFAYTPKVKASNFSKYGDFSYGIYIFAFPIQQSIVQLFKNNLNPITNIAVSLPIVIGLSFVSWHIIEKSSLKMKGKILMVATRRSRKNQLPVA